MPGTRWFFTGMALLAAVAVFAGFAPTYFFKSLDAGPPLSGLLHVHGAVFTSWIVLLIAQAALVATRRTDVHRRLGVLGGGLAAAMTGLAYAVTIDAARRGSTIPGMSPQAFMVIPFATVVVFPLLVGAALWYRRRPDIHKRLMLIATNELIVAGVGRLPVIATSGPLAFFGISDLFLMLMAAYDIATLGRVHRATLWGGLFLLVSQAVRVLLTASPAWASVVDWLIR